MTPKTLITRARLYSEKSGLAFSTISRKLLGGGTDLDRIAKGERSIRFDTLEAAFEKLAVLEAAFYAKAAETEDQA